MIGLFTFTGTSGSNYICSATAVRNNHIVTAAHCVYDTELDRSYTNKAFHPAYRSGTRPYGVFSVHACVVLKTWVDLSGSYSINSWARHDIAVCDVGRNSAGRTLNGAVGWVALTWGLDYNELIFNAGYPVVDYTGETYPDLLFRSCTAESFKQTTNTRGMGCPHVGGISGGPWVYKYKPNYSGGSNYVTGVNSGGFVGVPNGYGA